MLETRVKQNLILEHETFFAKKLALQVIDKPRLSIWMILIPIIFVYYFYRFQKFNTGRKVFAEHYMISIRRALNEASAVVDTGKKPDPVSLSETSDVPEAIRKYQADVYSILVEHYTDLLCAEGEDVESCIRSAYGNRTNYLLFFNRLNQAEKNRNQALKPLLQETTPEVNHVVERIERISQTLRREMAELIFPGQ